MAKSSAENADDDRGDAMNDPRPKYRNHMELVQGVSQVYDPRLSQGERLALLTIAAFTGKNGSHPGNENLMRACGDKTRKGVNYIIDQLIKKQLIEKIGYEKGGRGMATVYRLCTEDPRFPWPKEKAKPGSSDFPVSDSNPEVQTSTFSKAKPGSNGSNTRKYAPENPEVNAPKPGSSDFHPDTRADTTSDSTAEEEEGSPNGSLAAAAFAILENDKPFGSLRFQAVWIRAWEQNQNRLDVHNLPEVMEECLQTCQREGIKVPPPFFDSKRMAEFNREMAVRQRLDTPIKYLPDDPFAEPEGEPPPPARPPRIFGPAGRTREDHAERMRKNAKTLGLDVALLNPKK